MTPHTGIDTCYGRSWVEQRKSWRLVDESAIHREHLILCVCRRARSTGVARLHMRPFHYPWGFEGIQIVNRCPLREPYCSRRQVNTHGGEGQRGERGNIVKWRRGQVICLACPHWYSRPGQGIGQDQVRSGPVLDLPANPRS